MALRGTLTHRKTRRLAKALGIPPTYALGILEALWHVTAEQHPDGAIGRMSNRDIAEEMFYDGDSDELIEALEASGWIDAREDCGYYVHDWHVHADSYVHAHLAKRILCFASGHVPSIPHEAFNAQTRGRIQAQLSERFPDAPHARPGQVPDKYGQVPSIPVPEPGSEPEPVIEGFLTDEPPAAVVDDPPVLEVVETRPEGEDPSEKKTREPHELWKSISDCLTLASELLGVPPPTNEQVKRHLADSSHLRKVMNKHGPETAARMFAFASKTFKGSKVTWAAVWEAEADILAKMKGSKPSLKNTYDRIQQEIANA